MEQQRSLEWFRKRLGMLTGSSIGKLMGKGRGARFTQVGMTYLHEVAAERALKPELVLDDDRFNEYLKAANVSNAAMTYGTNLEAEARRKYEELNNVKVVETGSIIHPDFPHFSASPDGLVGDDGQVEIKCPYTIKTSFTYFAKLKSEGLMSINSDYYWQVQAQMACTGRKWCDFFVYDPRLSGDFVCVRINRNESDINSILTAVTDAETVIALFGGPQNVYSTSEPKQEDDFSDLPFINN